MGFTKKLGNKLPWLFYDCQSNSMVPVAVRFDVGHHNFCKTMKNIFHDFIMNKTHFCKFHNFFRPGMQFSNCTTFHDHENLVILTWITWTWLIPSEPSKEPLKGCLLSPSTSVPCEFSDEYSPWDWCLVETGARLPPTLTPEGGLVISLVSECDLDMPSWDRSLAEPFSVRDLVDERTNFEAEGVDPSAVVTPSVLVESEVTVWCDWPLVAKARLLPIGENTPDPKKKQYIHHKTLIIWLNNPLFMRLLEACTLLGDFATKNPDIILYICNS